MKPICFVLMPSGHATDDEGRRVDFDRLYEDVVRPACDDAGLGPVRPDRDPAGRFGQSTFERFMLSEYAVADLTITSPQLVYELGVRHGIRPHSTVLTFRQAMRLPFDPGPRDGLAYTLDAQGVPETPERYRTALADLLRSPRNTKNHRHLFHVLADWPRPQIARLKTDTFRDLVEYSTAYKDKLRRARATGAEAVAEVEAELNVGTADPAVVIDLLLSYRAVKDWAGMIALVARMAPVVAGTVMVREQEAFALNRLGRRDEAQAILEALIQERGPSTETNSLLGRVHKDRWQEYASEGQGEMARRELLEAIDAYVAGFESDWRDSYPGVNAVTLMELGDAVDPRQAELLPVVRYAVTRRLASSAADYWDHATRLELSVLASDRQAATDALNNALANIRESWEPQTTRRNLGLIRAARERRGTDCAWIADIERTLQQAETR